MPLWTALAWRSFYEYIDANSFEGGSQTIYDYRDLKQVEAMIAHPENIQNNKFDQNGLYGSDTGVTAYTGDWRLIGTDVTESQFDYNLTYALHTNPSVTFISAFHEDFSDIAVVKGELASKAIVRVKFVDENNAELADAIELKGLAGSEYRAEAKDITGYNLLDVNQKVKIGLFENDVTEVIFVYRKKAPELPNTGISSS